MRQSLDSQTAALRQIVYGKNLIDVPIPNVISLLLEQILHPFYIFQVFSCIVWILDQYWVYAICIAVVATISALISLWETRRNLVSLRKMARYECDINVLRNGTFVNTKSSTLLPGEIVEVKGDDFVLPCDMVLLSGQCIVNESMLTGESIPVIKNALPYQHGGEKNEEEEEAPSDESTVYMAEKHKRYTLFAGTKVIQTRYFGDDKVLAIVSRTGFSTSKGRMVLSILFPKPAAFKFYEDSFKFIGVLAGLALLGFAFTIYSFIKFHVKIGEIILRACDLVTIVVPPALPVAMTVGTAFAMDRLKRQKIFCISPPRVNVSGKLKLMCFDKTGTLTEDGLDFYGVQPVAAPAFSSNASGSMSPVASGKPTFMPLDEKCESVPTELLHTLATCHSLTFVNHKMIGDPLEVKIFEATRWVLKEPTSTNQYDTVIPTIVHPPPEKVPSYNISDDLVELPYELGILKRFDFSSALQRMSVIVKNLKTNQMTVYVKGSPEMIKQLSLPETVPADFAEVLHQYTHQGYRVLACGYSVMEPGSSWMKVQKMSRQKVEQGINFLGFIIMKNQVKADTKPAIQTLTKASVRSVMVTGDNALTAISVARECELVGPNRRVFLGDVNAATGQLEWRDTDATESMLDPETLLPKDGYTGKYELAVTGAAFEQLTKMNAEAPDSLFKRVLVASQIFARMSPDQKTRLVEELMELGYFVGMCGDGANDCGALKASHVGVSLSEAEASIAAPFTSTKPTIECVPTLMREGRAALATSFQMFKYMALYSIIQFTSAIIMYNVGSNLGDWQYLEIDLLIILPIVVLMGRTGASKKLVKRTPPGSLITRVVFFSLIGQILITVLFQVLVVIDVTRQPWYVKFVPTDNIITGRVACHLNSAVFLVSQFQYIWVAIAYSIGRPFRKEIYSNILYSLWLLLLTGYCTYLLFYPAPKLAEFLELDIGAMDMAYRGRLFGYALANFVACLLFEYIMVVGPGRKCCRIRRHNKQKKYKLLQSYFDAPAAHKMAMEGFGSSDTTTGNRKKGGLFRKKHTNNDNHVVDSYSEDDSPRRYPSSSGEDARKALLAQ
eukprot:GEZU01015029.1.p1 GENE.GEZU01015029.1~~GEZU01015029.1.p1  ORF type:complete len:1111 (+),score=339.90 GEZU01015029.1:130-3333(+)